MPEYRWVTDAPIEDVQTAQRWDQLRQSFRIGLDANSARAPAAARARNDGARALLDQMNFAADCRNVAYLFMGAAVGLMQVEVPVERIPDRARGQAPRELFKMFDDRPVLIREFATAAPGTGAGDALMEYAVNIAASTSHGSPMVSLMAHGGAVRRYEALGFVRIRGSLNDGMIMLLKPAQSQVWASVGGEWRVAARIGEQYPVGRGDPGFRQ